MQFELFWFIRCDTQNIRLKNTANSTKLYRIQVHWNVFCKWKIQQQNPDGDCRVCIMPLRTKPSQYLCFYSSHPQTLASFPVIPFPPKLVRLEYTCKFMFLSILCTRCNIFSILMCLELWHVNDQIIKTATLIYLIIMSLWTKKKIAIPDSNFYIQFIVVCGLGKVKHKEKEVTEGWRVLYRV